MTEEELLQRKENTTALLARAFLKTDAIEPYEAAASAEELIKSLTYLADLFKQFSEAEGTEMPNRLLIGWSVIEDGISTGSVELILRRVRPGCTSYETLLALSGKAEGE